MEIIMEVGKGKTRPRDKSKKDNGKGKK